MHLGLGYKWRGVLYDCIKNKISVLLISDIQRFNFVTTLVYGLSNTLYGVYVGLNENKTI